MICCYFTQNDFAKKGEREIKKKKKEKSFTLKNFFYCRLLFFFLVSFFSSSSSFFIVKWGFTVFKATNDGTHAYSIGLCCAVLTSNRAMYEKKEACKKEDFILDDVEFFLCCVTDLASVENRWWLTHLVRLLSQHTILLTKHKKIPIFIFFSITFDFFLFLHLYLCTLLTPKEGNHGPWNWFFFLLFLFLSRICL